MYCLRVYTCNSECQDGEQRQNWYHVRRLRHPLCRSGKPMNFTLSNITPLPSFAKQRFGALREWRILKITLSDSASLAQRYIALLPPRRQTQHPWHARGKHKVAYLRQFIILIFFSANSPRCEPYSGSD